MHFLLGVFYCGLWFVGIGYVEESLLERLEVVGGGCGGCYEEVI